MEHFNHICVYTRIVELGSFTKAADDMELSQSTITKITSSLEVYLGMRLLNRNMRGMRRVPDSATLWCAGPFGFKRRGVASVACRRMSSV
jgi:hypothetical protein